MEANHQLIRQLENGYRMEKPDFAPNYIGEIMSGCWKLDPNERLTFSQIDEKISSQMESVVTDDYLNLKMTYEKFNKEKANVSPTEPLGLAKTLDCKEKVAKRHSLPSRINSSTAQMKTKLSKKFSLKETPESVDCEPLPCNDNKPENFFRRLGRRFSLYYEFREVHILFKK